MSAWAFVPIAALVLTGAAAVAQAAQLWRGRDATRAIGWVVASVAVLLWAAFLYLLARFVVVDVSYQYVFQYTSTTVPLAYRVAGTWTGREGSLLLWTAFTATAAALLARPGKPDGTLRARQCMLLVLLCLLAAFLWAVVAQDTFAPTPDFLLQGRPGGNGLNPTLRSPFILIHPPLMFLAYALTAVTASSAVATMILGSRDAARVNLPWSRVNWLLYSIAIGLGGIWAYYTLGFGGYWGWDPVELANLLPWIALTMYLHAQVHHVKHGDYRFALPFLGLLPFVFTLFSAISTRSGLWFSVHAFTDPTGTFNPDGPGRFLGILDLEPIVAFYVGLCLATLFAGLALWGRRMATDDGHMETYSRITAGLYGALAVYAFLDPIGLLGLAFQVAVQLPGPMALALVGVLFVAVLVPALPGLTAPAQESVKTRWLSERTLLYGSVATLGLGLLLFTLFHFQTVNGWDRRFYDARFPWLITPVLVLLILLQGHALVRGRQLAALVAGSLLVAGAAWLLVPGQRGGAYLAVLAFAALGVGIERLRRAMTAKAAPQWRLGGFFLWLAAALDLLFWVNPPSRIPLLPWAPVWPTQLVMGLASLLVLFAAQRNLAGRPILGRWGTHVAAGLLGGFYLAPVLALAAYFLQRRGGGPAPSSPSAARSRFNTVAMQGLHVAFVLGLVGFSLSTYFTSETTATLAQGQTAEVGPYDVTFTQASTKPTTGLWADKVLPTFDVKRGGQVAQLAGILYWEPQNGAHFPLPNTLRAWDGDLYADVRRVCIDGNGTACTGGSWIQVYKASPRIAPNQDVGAVDVNLIHLPGLGIVWMAWALAAFYMAQRLAAQRAPVIDPVASSDADVIAVQDSDSQRAAEQ